MTRTISTALMSALLVWQLGCGPGGSSSRSLATAASGEDVGAAGVGVSRQALEPTRAARAIPGAAETIPSIGYRSSVDENGAARISVPLWTPAGRGGIEPHLSLEYSSRGGKGLAGVGFSLSGLSAIARCWKTPAVDGAYSVSEFEDEFCLDGERLIRGSGGEFRLESSGGTKVVATGGLADPTSFTLYRLDGTIASYGSRDSSSKAKVSTAPTNLTRSGAESDEFVASAKTTERTASWNVDRVEDRWGNFMEVDYQRIEDTSVVPNTVEVVPSEIRWTGWSGSPAVAPSRKVVFTYQAALDVRRQTTAQLRIEHSRLLSKVQVWAENRWSNEASGTMSMFREYRLGYLTPKAATRTVDRLSSVTECYGEAPAAADGTAPTLTTCSDPLVFDWSGTSEPEVPQFTTSLHSEVAASVGTSLDMTATDIFDAVVGDFNGDGFDDYLFRRQKTVNGFPTQKNLDGGIVLEGEWLVALGGATGLGVPVLTHLPLSAGGTFQYSPRVLDFDGDGRADVGILEVGDPQYSAGAAPQTQEFSVFSWDGSDFKRRNGLGTSMSYAPQGFRRAPRTRPLWLWCERVR